MKSDNYKILTDDNGTKFQFSPEKFDHAITQFILDKQKESMSKITRNSIIELIAEQCHISKDAVQNWKKGSNGPSDIDLVKHCATVLRVNYYDLLTPLSSNYKPTKSEDAALVRSVFEKTLEIIWSQFFIEDEQLREKYKRNIQKENDVAKLELMINQKALCTSDDVRNRLHKLVLEMREIIISGFWVDSWDDSVRRYESCMWFHYGANSKEEQIKEGDSPTGPYISDEITTAIDLGLPNIKEIDEDFDPIDYENAVKYGYCGELELPPFMVFQHMVAKYITEAFRFYFSDILN